MTEFKVNDYIELRLENGHTNIYVNGMLFNQCRYLMLNIPVEDIPKYDEIDSIDDAIEILDRSMEGDGRFNYDISI